MAAAYGLTQEERDRLLPSGKQRVMDNRVSWALSYLVQADLVERPQRGQVRITQLGRDALTANPERIDMKVLEAYPGYQRFNLSCDVVPDLQAEAGPDLRLRVAGCD